MTPLDLSLDLSAVEARATPQAQSSATRLALLKRIDPAVTDLVRADRGVLEVLASAQRQLMRIRSRYSR